MKVIPETCCAHKDGRWQYGTPPTGNANYAWIQHFIYHLAPSGQAGFVLAKGALTSKTSGEGEIRRVSDDVIGFEVFVGIV
jgi:type I restriction-modification system DNA methylase subunit